jgi:hypothetical protein
VGRLKPVGGVVPRAIVVVPEATGWNVVESELSSWLKSTGLVEMVPTARDDLVM